MANKTIGQLSSLTPSSTSLFAMYENGSTGKATLQQILDTDIPGLGSTAGMSVKDAVNDLKTDFEETNFLIPGDDQEEETEQISFTSYDTVAFPNTPDGNVELLSSADSWSARFEKISKMFKNIRYLLKMLGSTDISTLGDGTVTGILNTLNTSTTTLNTSVENLSKMFMPLYAGYQSIGSKSGTNTSYTSVLDIGQVTLQPGTYLVFVAGPLYTSINTSRIGLCVGASPLVYATTNNTDSNSPFAFAMHKITLSTQWTGTLNVGCLAQSGATWTLKPYNMTSYGLFRIN